MKLKKLLSMFLSATMVLSLAASCGGDSKGAGSEADDEKGEAIVEDVGAGSDATKMTMWVFVKDHATFYNEMQRQWNATHEGKEQVNIEITQYTYDVMHNKFTIELTSGGDKAPDMVDVEIGKFPNYLKGEVQLMELNKYIDEYRDDVVESRLTIYSKGGKEYGVPTHVGGMVAFYNTTILEEAGVDYKKIVTWDDYKKAGQTVIDKTDHYMGISEWNNTVIYDMMMVSQGADKVDEAGNPTFNTPESIKALETIQEFYRLGIDNTIDGGHPDTDEGKAWLNKDLSEGGNFATVIRPIWMMSRYIYDLPNREGEIAIAECPVFEEGQNSSFGGGGTGTVVTTSGANPELAAEWLTYAKLSEDGSKGIWEVLGFDPVNMSKWEDKEFTHDPDNQYNQYFLNSPFDVLNEVKDKFGTVKTTLGSPTIGEWFNQQGLIAIIENDEDVADVVAQGQEECEAEVESILEFAE